jgi:uncharacterized membrane protein YfcA
VIETLTGTTLLQLAVIWGIVFVAGFVRGLTGVGLAVVLVPLVNLVLPPERTVLLAVLIGCLVGLMGYRSAWRNVDQPLVLTIAVATVAATPLGLLLLFSTPDDVARIAIVAIAMLAFIVMIAPRAALPPQGKGPAILTGLLTGFLGAFAAIPGPPVIFYFVRQGVPAAATRDAMIVIFFWAPLAVALIALALGKLDWQLAALSLACFPALASGNVLGTRLFGRVPEAQWRMVVVILIGIAAIGAVIWKI